MRENQISSSQEGLHNLGENEGMIHPLGDPDNQEFAQDGQELDGRVASIPADNLGADGQPQADRGAGPHLELEAGAGGWARAPT